MIVIKEGTNMTKRSASTAIAARVPVGIGVLSVDIGELSFDIGVLPKSRQKEGEKDIHADSHYV